jgi:hypothetical protein
MTKFEERKCFKMNLRFVVKVIVLVASFFYNYELSCQFVR